MGNDSIYPGMRVTSRVRLVEPLAQGGMGRVWLGRHLTLRKDVAVKFVDLHKLERDPTIVRRFLQEAMLTAQLNSPHVVAMLDHGVTDDGLPFIVMERLEGVSLYDHLRHGGAPMDPDEVGVVVDHACRALGQAHELDIVHRDIKPSNLFLLRGTAADAALGEPLVVKVLDFGLAKKLDGMQLSADTATGTIVGTPAYMSPEQALTSRDVDGRADLWALAVVAYHALTGHPPFQGETLGSLCVAIAEGAFTPPGTWVPSLPATIDDFFRKAFAKAIDDRFQTAPELADAFLDALAGRAAFLVPAARESLEGATVTATPVASRRRLNVVALVAAVCVGLGLGQLGSGSPVSVAPSPAAEPLEPVARHDAPLPVVEVPAAVVEDLTPPDAPPAPSANASASASKPMAPPSPRRTEPAKPATQAPTKTPTQAPAGSTFWGF